MGWAHGGGEARVKKMPAREVGRWGVALHLGSRSAHAAVDIRHSLHSGDMGVGY